MPATTPAELPTGTLTFLFTDIEGSTEMLARLGDRYVEVLEQHAVLIRQAIAAHEGIEVSTEGDAFFAVFRSAHQAVAAAADAQRALVDAEWSAAGEVRVRMGLHTGEARIGGDNYAGLAVNRAARISAAGHGGQVLLSETTRALIASDLPAQTGLRDLGQHRLKDLPESERVWQLDMEGVPGEFPALRSVDARPNNLPTPATPLIGRAKGVAEVGELLERRRHVTMTGPGGSGKTRLALAVAEADITAFADGAFFVRLEDAVERDSVVAAIASALSVREKVDRDLEGGVRAYLRDRELLLVLDNFEQAMASAPLVGELLAESPKLKVIVTSRERLHLSGEQEYAVPPLDLPDPDNLPPLAALSQYESVALFIDRAVAAKADFRVTNDNAPAVAEICSRLDGLPLAIELAAARVRLLSPQAILERLDRRLGLLTGGARNLPDRQRTLQGAIDWSFELLQPTEQRLLERLSAFAGGWTLEAADEVCAPAELGIDVLDGLESLADKSLISPTQVEGGESRFAMLQVMREFAANRLDARGDGDGVRRRHALWVAELTEAADPELIGTDIRSWQLRLQREEENIRTALRWALDHGEAEIGLRIAGSLWQFWHYWAHVREGRDWLEALLAMPAANDVQEPRARGLSGLAAIVYWQGDAARSEALYREALAILDRVGDDVRRGEVLHNVAWALVAQSDFPGAAEHAQAAISAYERAGFTAGARIVHAWLRSGSFIMGAGGSLEDAVAAVKEAIEENRRIGRLHEVADSMSSLTIVYQRAGDSERAMQYGLESMNSWNEIGNIGRLSFFKLLAELELALGRPERAVVLHGAADRHADEVGGDLPDALTGVGDPAGKARELLPADTHARLYERGRSMTSAEMVDFALESRR